MTEVFVSPGPMLASFPVYRSGLVLESSPDLTPEQAIAGAKYLSGKRLVFTNALEDVLLDKGAPSVLRKGARGHSRGDGDEAESRSVRFEDMQCTIGRYEIEVRLGVTLCEEDRQSKVALRVLGVSVDGKPADGLSQADVMAFFDACANWSKDLTKAAVKAYTDCVGDFVKKTPGIKFHKGATKFDLDEKYAFTMRAFDADGDTTFELIDDLADGERLSDMLKNDEYRRVFNGLWNVAYHLNEDADRDADTVLETLRTDKTIDVAVMEKPFVDHLDRDRVEQRALFVSRLIEHQDEIDTIDFTGIACKPLFDLDLDDEINRDSAAFRMSGHLFAKYASQF